MKLEKNDKQERNFSRIDMMEKPLVSTSLHDRDMSAVEKKFHYAGEQKRKVIPPIAPDNPSVGEGTLANPNPAV